MKQRLSILVLLVLLCGAVASAQTRTVLADQVQLLTVPCTMSSGAAAPTGGADCDMYAQSGGWLWIRSGGYWVKLSTSGAGNVIAVDGAAGTFRMFSAKTAGVARWQLGAEATAESGSNAGSDFVIGGFTDAGVTTGDVIKIARSSLTTSFSHDVDFLSDVYVGGVLVLGTGIGGTFQVVGQLILNGPAQTWRNVLGQTSGESRWSWGVDNVAESGSNAGSNWSIYRADDDGNQLGSAAIHIDRSTGHITFTEDIRSWGPIHTDEVGWGTGAATPLVVGSLSMVAGGATTVTGALTAAADLTLSPTGDLVTDPTGKDVLPNVGYDINLGSLSKKYLSLHAAELWVETLVAQNTIATIGGRILVGTTTVLVAGVADDDTHIHVKHNSPVNGDVLYLEANGNVESMKVTSSASGSAGNYQYSVTRNWDAEAVHAWYAGDAVFDTGQVGSGFIDLYAVRGVKVSTEAGPTIVGNVRTGTAWNAWAPRWAIGNLDGLYGYSGTTYGFAAGDSAGAWIAADATNGLRIMGGATPKVTIDASGNASIDGVLSIGASGAIQQGTSDGDGHYTGLKLYNASGVGKLATYNNSVEQVVLDTDGKLKAGGGSIVLDADGLYIDPRSGAGGGGYSAANAIRWNNDSTYRTAIWKDENTTLDRGGVLYIENLGSRLQNNDILVVSRGQPAIGGSSATSALLVSGSQDDRAWSQLSSSLSDDNGDGFYLEFWNPGTTKNLWELGWGARRTTPDGSPSALAAGMSGTATTVTATGDFVVNGAQTINGNGHSLRIQDTADYYVDLNIVYDAGPRYRHDLTVKDNGTVYTPLSFRAGNVGVGATASGDRLFVATGNIHIDDGYGIGAGANAQIIYDATSSSSYLRFDTGGSERMKIYDNGSVVVGAPTGGAKGAGTINAVAVYDDNVLLSDWVFEAAYSEPQSLGFDPLLPIGPKKIRPSTVWTLSDTIAATKGQKRLPWMPTPDEFDTERHTGGMITRLWVGQEHQQLYITDHEARVKALESEIAALKARFQQPPKE